ncbi:MAG: ParB/RepB/Spo0J family partition protein [Litorimonas sp.]
MDRFDVPRGYVLSGQTLREVASLEDSIAERGLLSPIVVIECSDRLVVVDGRKRLAAIRRLAFKGRLPASLSRIPYILTSQMKADERRAPVLVSNRELYRAVIEEFRSGDRVGTLSHRHNLSRQCVRDIISLSRLSPVLRAAFFERLIDFSQARAYAAIPDPDIQLLRLKALGPFASASEILGNAIPDAIRNSAPGPVAA